MRIQDIKMLVIETFKDWSEDKAGRLAAALSYYTVFSLPPLLIILLAIAGRFFENAEARVTAQIVGLVGETGGEAIAAILENASQPEESIVASIIGVVMLLFGASGVFGQLQEAMNTIWEVPPEPKGGILNLIQGRFFSFTMVLGMGFLLLVSLVISAWLASLDELVNNLLPSLVVLAQIINFIVSIGVISIVFALIFKVIPDVHVSWHDVWIGAVVTAVLFTLGKWAISFYLSESAPASSYGAAGSIIVILLWIYYSAQILFLGAEFTQVYANKFGSKIVPEWLEQEREEAKAKAEGKTAAQPRPAAGPAISAATHRQVVHLEESSPVAHKLGQVVDRFHNVLVTMLAVPTALFVRSRRARHPRN